jgi:post-segregation antitoxin (ccd killing protein)
MRSHLYLSFMRLSGESLQQARTRRLMMRRSTESALAAACAAQRPGEELQSK